MEPFGFYLYVTYVLYTFNSSLRNVLCPMWGGCQMRTIYIYFEARPSLRKETFLSVSLSLTHLLLSSFSLSLPSHLFPPRPTSPFCKHIPYRPPIPPLQHVFELFLAQPPEILRAEFIGGEVALACGDAGFHVEGFGAGEEL